ncbi:uncharacterized protein LOC122721891 [Manihot esculenta]|nr:uncharacterized protein LOC122721891 [Manihot esculenta]
MKTTYYTLKKEKEMSSSNTASTSSVVSSGIWNKIWNLKVPLKLVFIWKACNNALPSRDNLFKRHIAPSPFCQICSKEEETSEHLLFFCPHASATWFSSSLGFKLNKARFGSLSDWWQSLFSIHSSHDNYFTILCSVLCWQLWKSRNQAIFNQTSPNPVVTNRKAHNVIGEVQQLVLP